jgi:hypothetical protein
VKVEDGIVIVERMTAVPHGWKKIRVKKTLKNEEKGMDDGGEGGRRKETSAGDAAITGIFLIFLFLSIL